MAGDLLQPVVPDAQKNKSPEILLEGFKTGFAMAAQMAQQRRKAETDIAEMAQRERIAQESHAIQRERIQKDYNLQSGLNAAHIRAYNSAANLNTERSKHLATGIGTAAERAAFKLQQMELLNNAFNADVQKEGLDDLQVAALKPVDYAAGLVKVNGRWGLSASVSPYIKGALGQFRAQAEDQKLHMKPVDYTGGTPKVSGQGKDVPIYKIYMQLANPGTRDATMEALRLNGHLYDVPGDSKLAPGWFNTEVLNRLGLGRMEEGQPTRDVPTSAVKPIFDAQKRGVKFQREKSRVPQSFLNIFTPQPGAPAAAPTAAPDEEQPVDELGGPVSSVWPNYDVDNVLARAQDAIRRGAHPKAVAQRLTERWGIDPTRLGGADASSYA